MYLYLVRHGESEGNILGTFHGWTDYPLTERGREQARQAGRKLKDKHFTRCCASDLKRAWETARLCLEGRDILPESCPDLREHFMGEMEGLTLGEMEERYPEQLDNYRNDWFRFLPPGGETVEELEARVGRCVDAIIARGEDTLIAAHHNSLTMLLIHLGVLKPEEAFQEGTFIRQGTYIAIEMVEGKARLLGFDL